MPSGVLISVCQALRTAVFTASGSGTYSRLVAMGLPFEYAQSKNLSTLALRAGSFGSFGSRTKVAETIGQLVAPGWSIRLTAKFFAPVQSPLAAAAVKASIVGFTKCPALLRSCTVFSLFCEA